MCSISGIMSSPGGAFGKGRESGRRRAAHAGDGIADGNASAPTSVAVPRRKSRRPTPPVRCLIAPTGGRARTLPSCASTPTSYQSAIRNDGAQFEARGATEARLRAPLDDQEHASMVAPGVCVRAAAVGHGEVAGVDVSAGDVQVTLDDVAVLHRMVVVGGNGPPRLYSDQVADR